MANALLRQGGDACCCGGATWRQRALFQARCSARPLPSSLTLEFCLRYLWSRIALSQTGRHWDGRGQASCSLGKGAWCGASQANWAW